MYIFNSDFLFSLDNILGIKKKTLYQCIGITPTTFGRWRHNNDLSLIQLLALLNKLHIPSAIMFTYISPKTNLPYVSDQAMALIPSIRNGLCPYPFRTITVSPRHILTDMLSYQGYSKDDVCDILRCSSYDISVWFRDDGLSTLPVSIFLTIVNRFRVLPSAYIHDANCPIPPLFGYSKTMLSPTQALRLQIKTLQEHISYLERRL